MDSWSSWGYLSFCLSTCFPSCLSSLNLATKEQWQHLIIKRWILLMLLIEDWVRFCTFAALFFFFLHSCETVAFSHSLYVLFWDLGQWQQHSSVCLPELIQLSSFSGKQNSWPMRVVIKFQTQHLFIISGIWFGRSSMTSLHACSFTCTQKWLTSRGSFPSNTCCKPTVSSAAFSL